MNFLVFFDNAWFHSVALCFVVFYLLMGITFAAHFSGCEKFDRPVLLSAFNQFSCFFFCLILWLFCFDFTFDDKQYFFNQNFQLLFVFFIICVLYCSYDFLKAKQITKYEYDLLFVFVIFSGICLCFCNEFLLIYLAIELQVLLSTFLQHLTVILNFRQKRDWNILFLVALCRVFYYSVCVLFIYT
jgi:NADH:ubiquinone oxidoreductase subunit 2 (subunit N)